MCSHLQRVGAGGQLLANHAGDGDHRNAPVVELLELLFVDLVHALSLEEAEGVEPEVAGGVVSLEQEKVRRLEGVLPRELHARALGDDDDGGEGAPERGGDLLEVVDGGAGDVGVEEEGAALDLLADEEAERGEHGDAAVGDLHVGVALGLALVDAVEEAEDVQALGEGGDARDEASLGGGLDVSVLLAAGDLDGAGGGLGGDHDVHGGDAGHC
mmetsp:Transcript_28015/g.68959  ORF Transcript_28015/g.68959 Transcript_28015/m.68959 type:complete len:214 (-) Transcript_28015:133-774(-)